tara:strand:- start:1766 stop:2347 length:582 start_codon:yes stop_codon:yes gene_type:complete
MSILSFKQELLRKGIHACNSIIAFSLFFLDQKDVLLIVAISAILIVVFDFLRIYTKPVQRIYNFLFKEVTRDFESHRLTGASYVMIGALIVLSIFESRICIPALLIMSFSDSAAAIIGKKYGKTKIFNKTLEGSLAFLLTSFVIVIFFIPDIDFTFSIIAIIASTIVELVPKSNLDDNLLIPIVSAFIISLGG